MNYYGTFDPHQEQWFPDEEKPVCRCDSCDCEMYAGQDGFEMEDGAILCEDCFDKWMDGIRREMRLTIGEDR